MAEIKKHEASTQILLILITLAAGTIRLITLAHDSFWYDEILTLNVAQLGRQAALSVEDHPPLLYILTSLSIQIFGVNQFAVRLFSAIAGMMSVGLLGWWGIMIERKRVGILAATLLALSPFHLRYSQEARHYALLMFFSLLMLVSLQMALTKMNWYWWLSFAFATLLNLYTHYSGVLVLLLSSVIIFFWFVKQSNWKFLRFPLTSAIIVFLGYLFWLPRFIAAFAHNQAAEASIAQSGFSPTPLTIWLKNAFVEFGYRGNMLPFLTLALFTAGCIILIRQRKWLMVSIIMLLIMLPLIFINTLQIGRYAFPKYIIYMLPCYLLAVAIALDKALQYIANISPLIKTSMTNLMIGILLPIALFPQLYAEYLYSERDWDGALESISSEIKSGDIFIPITLDLNDSFNQGKLLLSHYVDRLPGKYLILNGTNLGNLTYSPVNESTNVWVFAINRVTPMKFEASSISSHEFSGKLFLVTSDQTTINEQISSIYSALIPVAATQYSKCNLRENIVKSNIQAGAWGLAEAKAVEFRPLCPDHEGQLADLQYIIYKEKMVKLIDQGKRSEAIEIAYDLWQLNRKEPDLLEILTVYDFNQHFMAGDSQLNLNNSPEPVDIRRFVMPQNGDWGDVLFVHPPAEVSFNLTLPLEKVNFYTRVAMAPESWSYGGDGSTFVVKILANGIEHELLRKHINNQAEDRRWHTFTIPLDAYSGKGVILTLTTEGGPNGDTTGDWAGFESPRIIWQ